MDNKAVRGRHQQPLGSPEEPGHRVFRRPKGGCNARLDEASAPWPQGERAGRTSDGPRLGYSVGVLRHGQTQGLGDVLLDWLGKP